MALAPPRLDCRRRDDLDPLHPERWGDLGPAAAHLRENHSGAPPAQPTLVHIAFTWTHFLVSFHCLDREPWATFTQRKSPLYQEEVVEVFLDPYGDQECYFEIELNPLNTCCELMLRRTRAGWRKELTWECAGLVTSAKLVPDGWLARMAIPFASVTSHPVETGMAWRANFLRIDRPPGAPRELSAWAPTECGTFHVPARFGFIYFV